MKQLARNLRHDQTDAESLLWRHLRDRRLDGFKFRRQYWIESYIVDFICVERRTVVEVDGSQHAEEIKVASDKKRTAFLKSRGFNVLRFWNNEIINDTDAVLENILTTLRNTTPHPPLSPQWGEGQKIATAHPDLSLKGERG